MGNNPFKPCIQKIVRSPDYLMKMESAMCVSRTDKLNPQLLRIRGFSLIELMVTVAIVAILASIALPSYTSYVERARRADARTQLLQAAQFMQRFYAANDQYFQDRASNGVLGTSVGMPENLRRSPADGAAIYQLNTAIAAAGNYTASVTTTAYTLTMAPISGGSMAADACGMFTISSSGIRGVVGATRTRDECWK